MVFILGTCFVTSCYRMDKMPMDKMVEREPLTQTFLKSCSFSWSETFVLNSDDDAVSLAMFIA